MIDCFLDYSYTGTGETKERKLDVCVRGVEINVKECQLAGTGKTYPTSHPRSASIERNCGKWDKVVNWWEL